MRRLSVEFPPPLEERDPPSPPPPSNHSAAPTMPGANYSPFGLTEEEMASLVRDYNTEDEWEIETHEASLLRALAAARYSLY